MIHRLLVVDDHALFLELTRQFLERSGYEVDTASSADEAIKLVRRNGRRYSLVILDYILDKRDGADVAKEILAVRPEQFILIYSNDLSREAIRKSWKAGAVEFVDKGTKEDAFLEVIKKWCERHEDSEQIRNPLSLDESGKLIQSIGMVGVSPQLAEVVGLALRYRQEPSTVLVLGESGTGKEMIALALHGGNNHPFRAVNCASYNGEATLMESELFGIEKDSFTGANRDKKGVFEEVGRGTVFLDEIHTLSLRAQQKLLRVLQEKTIRPVGSTRETRVFFRLVAASKPNLEAMVQKGDFMLDLYYRLNVLRIEVPSLRERKEDILPLILHFAAKNARDGKKAVTFHTKTIDYLRRYPWPGNVRELENTIEQLSATVTGDAVGPDDLDAKFFVQHPRNCGGTVSSLREEVSELTRERVVAALEKSSSQREAARRLGVAHSTFHRLLQHFGLADRVKGKRGRRPKEPNFPTSGRRK